MDETLKLQLQRIAKNNPPIGYVVSVDEGWSENVYAALADHFPLESKERRMIERGRLEQEENGLIIFGYPDKTPITPILDVLKKIPMDFFVLTLSDGREVGFISHTEARQLLPRGDEVRRANGYHGCFDEYIIATLESKQAVVLPGKPGSGLEGLVATLRWMVMDDGMAQKALEAVVARGGRPVHGA